MVCVEQSRKDQCRFEIVITGRIFSLLANDANEAKEWLTALTSQIGHRRKYNAPRARSNSDPKVEKYWKHPESVLDDLHSPKQPSSAQSRSNAFTKVELSQLPSLSSFSNQSGIKRLTVIRPDDSITLVSQHTPVISNDVRSSLRPRRIW
uniref:PH domain-containing protein n=1 Tax=Spongospora subterranea TaxID=70186 RepID=A0A0H5RS59_9EUKA|eukprot:CRZ11569.1 hypothetical protein [Spongospora subterranea]